MRPKQTFTRYHHHNIRNRLAALQMKYAINDTARQIIQSEIEAASLYWFLRGGGTEEEFDKLFNNVTK